MPKTCDLCRTRKTKCIPSEIASSECTICIRSRVTCTYNRGYKKPGRPTRPSTSRSSVSTAREAPDQAETTDAEPATAGASTLQTSHDPVLTNEMPGSLPGASDTSSSLHTQPQPSADLSGIFSPVDLSWALHDVSPDQQRMIDAPTQPAMSLSIGGSASSCTSRSVEALRRARIQLQPIAPSSDMQLEDVAPWSTLTYFIALYLRMFHSLFPLVHKPTFSTQVALRSDYHDRPLRALILGLVAYTIGQSPLSYMQDYDREELQWLQHRCHQASMLLVDRSYKTLSVVQVATIMAGYFYCQSICRTNRAIALLAEACQITHVLTTGDALKPENGTIDNEMRKRLFWHVFAVDVTETCAGHILHLYDRSVPPPLPANVDDSLIAEHGIFPNVSETCDMTGFNGCVQLFPILAECLTRHGRIKRRKHQGEQLNRGEVAVEIDWVENARISLAGLMRNLPPSLRSFAGQEDRNQDSRAIRGMQTANIIITETSIQVALSDFLADLSVGKQSAVDERLAIARGAIKTIGDIPLEQLAANGESIRAKIFHIVLALMRVPDPDPSWAITLAEWWELISNVHFVQLPAPNLESALPTRQGSPHRGGGDRR